VSSVIRPHQHSIGYTGDGFYRSKDPTNQQYQSTEGDATKEKKQRKQLNSGIYDEHDACTVHQNRTTPPSKTIWFCTGVHGVDWLVVVQVATKSRLDAANVLRWYSDCRRHIVTRFISYSFTLNGQPVTYRSVAPQYLLYTVSQKKNCATFIFTATLANVGRFLKFFQCRNQKELAHNRNEKFPTVA